MIRDGSGERWAPSRDYRPSALPGCPAPHLWLSESESLYDRFGDGFTLLVFAGTPDVAEARAEAAESGTPLDIVAIPDARLVTLYGARMALVRPDQHVTWRGEEWPADAQLLRTVSGRGSTVSPHAARRRAAD